jgi:hypothetical protein
MPDNSPTLEAPEMGEMAFCAALLFAFPAIRNAQPFAPTMGMLSDYLGFFWAESIVAISLIIKLNIWLSRKSTTDTPGHQPLSMIVITQRD